MLYKKQTFSALFMLAIGLTAIKAQKPIIDIDGNTYKTVTIGTQTWMAENLKVTKYNDGTVIPNITNNTKWSSITTGAVCSFNNTTNAKTIKTYGILYNWHAVNTGKLCPTGWHVPSNAEWVTLETYLIDGGYNYDGRTTENNIAKAMASTIGWKTSFQIGAIGNSPSTNNKSGFSALPRGGRYHDGTFDGIGYYGLWWSSTEGSASIADYKNLTYFGSDLISYYETGYKVLGCSVRCLKN